MKIPSADTLPRDNFFKKKYKLSVNQQQPANGCEVWRGLSAKSWRLIVD
jgi:hypothetical protein